MLPEELNTKLDSLRERVLASQVDGIEIEFVEIKSQLVTDEHWAKLDNIQGQYYYALKQFDLAKEHFIHAREMDCSITERLISKMNEGWILLHSGHYMEAELLFNKVINQSEQNNPTDRRTTAWSVNGLGMILMWRGDWDKSFTRLDQALAIFRELDDKDAIAATLTSMSSVRILQNKPHQALELLFEVSMIPIEEISLLRKGVAIFYQILIYMDLNRQDKLEELITQLEEFQKLTDDPLVHQGVKVAKAAYLMRSKRLSETIKAQTMLQEVCQAPEYFQSLTIIAMKYLIELNLMEYRVNGEQEVFDEIMGLVSRMEAIVSELNSYYLIAELRIFRCKLALIEDDIPSAIEHLNRGQEIAKQFQFSQLITKIQKEKDKLQQFLSQISNIGEGFQQRVEVTEILDYLERVQNLLPTI